MISQDAIVAPLLVLALVFLVAGGVAYMTALEQARPKFPAQFRDAHAARWFMTEFVSDRSAPPAIRRRFTAFLICMCISFACFTALMFVQGPRFGAFMFLGITLLAIGFTVTHQVRRGREMGDERHG